MQETKEHVEVADIGVVNSHDHLCLLYRGEAEILNLVLPFIQKGVAIGERCIYLNAAEGKLERVLKSALLTQKQDSGALILLPAHDVWLKGGAFKQARVLELLRILCSGAASDGFSGTRIICDMAWAADEAKQVELLPRFERELTLFAEQNEVTLLCLYNRELFSPERVLELAKMHPHLIVGGKACGNPLFIPTSLDPRAKAANCELDVFLAAVQQMAATAADRERLQQELEQAYAALARKIYENWQEEDTLRASEKEIHEKDEALLAYKRRLQTILQHIPALLMAFDTGDRLAACNHEFERVTGFRVEEVMGKPMLDLLQVEGELREEVVASHPPQGGDYRGREWSIRCKDGSLKTISWSNISRYVPIVGWVNWIVGLDVTPRLHAENGLRIMRDELEARTRELDAFGHAVSHDLSGRLSRMNDDCCVLQKLCGSLLSPPCREMLRKINEAALDLTAPIAALQRMTALAAAGVQPEEVDLSAMASEIAAQLRVAGARPVTFRIEDGVRVTGDKEMLRLAMEQLLENAWNYTVGVKHPVIQFGTAQVEGARSFYVSDNGPRLVEQPRGVAVGKADPPPPLFCGIGLATVQRIINLHRGRIWSAEQAGKGGTLYFQV